MKLIVIPKQLKDYRFIKTFRKHPAESGWPIDPVKYTRQKDGSYLDNIKGTIYKSKGINFTDAMTSYTYDEMSTHLKYSEKLNNKNVSYGVLGGYHGLVVIDLDDKKIADKLSRIWPFSETFTVLSGTKKLPHFYFKCQDYAKVVRYDSSSNKRILDIQATSTYVVGPESRFLSNNILRTYDIQNTNEILEVDYDEIIKVIEENLGEIHKIQKKEKHLYTDKYFTLDPITSEIFKRISCDTILNEANVDISHNPGDTPFAKSQNKKCLHRTDYLWYDHHIQDGGNVIQLYSRIHRIDIIKAKYDLAERAGVTEKIFREALQYFIKNQQHEMTELIAMKFMGTTPTHTIRSDKQRTQEIYIYKDGIYIPNGESYIREFCDNILGKWYTQNLSTKIVDKIAIRTKIDSEEFFQEDEVELIPVQNGLLNISNKKLYEFTPAKKFFNKLPVTFKPGIECEMTLKHFDTVLNGPQDVGVMQEIYGYLLLKDYRWEKAFMFYGKGGNGKSKTIEQMKHLIGEYNAVNLSLQQLQNEKFLRCNLHRKLGNLADDIGHAKLEETQMFKELTGGSTITVDRKHMDSLTFKNYAKMIFSANKIPDTVDDTDAFWRRWELLGFTKKFMSPLEYKKLKDSGTLKPEHREADAEIITKLTTEKELSGVLNWALVGLDRLFKNKGFSRTDSYSEVRTLWRRNVSTAIAFLQDKIEQTYHPEDYETHEDLYKAYIFYCIKRKARAESELAFKKNLQEENLFCQRKRVAHGYEWRWQGIKMTK